VAAPALHAVLWIAAIVVPSFLWAVRSYRRLA